GSQSIAVSVNGQTSSLPFTVTSSGKIRYVSSAGAFQGVVDDMVPGDIVYVMDGVTVPGGIAASYGSYYNTSGPLAVVAYPGATVTVGDAAHDAFVVTRSGTGYWMVYSKFNLVSASTAVEMKSNCRVVGSKLQVPLGAGASGVIGNGPFAPCSNV